jgi:hypothetical protein
MTDFPDHARLKQRQQLREIGQGFRRSQILLACVELGVFEALQRGLVTAGGGGGDGWSQPARDGAAAQCRRPRTGGEGRGSFHQ